jgi:hypothetical protein
LDCITILYISTVLKFNQDHINAYIPHLEGMGFTRFLIKSDDAT